MEFSEQAQTLLDSIIHRTLFYTDFLVNGTMTAQFTPLLRNPYAIKYIHPEILESEKDQKRLAMIISRDEIVALRDLTIDPEKGAWFSFSITVDVDKNWNVAPENKEYTLEFNYDKRFNVLADDWTLDPYELAFPTVDIYLADLRKRPRTDENQPEWLAEAYEEFEAESPLFNRVELTELFEDQLEDWPEMYGVYARGEGDPMWDGFWEKCNERIHAHLLHSKYVARPFIDDRFKFMQKDSLIWRAEEISEKSTDPQQKEESMKIEASLYNSYLVLAGHKNGVGPFHDLNNLDYKEVMSNFVDITYTLLLLQLQELFPEVFWPELTTETQYRIELAL